LLQQAPPFSSEKHTIVLCSRTPHGRPLRPVQHAKLNHGTIGNDAGITAERIYFPDNLTFSNSAHGRVARHLGNGLQVHGDQQNAGAHVGSRCRSFATGMAGAYYDNIICRVQ
jgi:hypothetical protein